MREFIETAMNNAGVRIWPSVTVEAVDADSIIFTSEAGVEVTLARDAVVDMSDMLPNESLVTELADYEVHVIGDASAAFNIAEAISSGNLCARSL